MPRLLLLLLLAVALVAGGTFVLGPDRRQDGDGALALGSAATPLGPVDHADPTLSEVPGDGMGARTRTAAAAEGEATGPRRAPKAETMGPAVPRLATGPFRGRLLDAGGGPIAGAALELRPWSERDEIQLRIGVFGPKPWPLGVSGKDGRFTVPHDARIGKSIAVIAKARGFQAAPFQAVLADAADPDLGDLYLERAVIVQGFVHDERRVPIAGARLRFGARDEDPRARMFAAFGMSGMLSLGETDEHGRFELPHVKPGELTLVAEHPEHHPARWTGTTPDAGGLLSDVDFELVRAGSIGGVVRDFPKGRRGVQVAARKLPDELGAARDAAAGDERESGMDALMSAALSPAGSETADVLDDGSFVLHGLARVGRYELTVVERQDFVRTVALSRVVTAESGARGVVMDYDAGATVRLRLLDRETQRPIEVAELSGTWGAERARIFFAADAVTRPKSFPGGVLQLFEVRPPKDPGTLSLEVVAPGYVEQRLPSFEVGARAVVDLGDVQLVPAAKLRFLVVDATTGKGISRAQVSVRQPNDVDDPRQLMQRGMDAAGRTVKDRTDKEGRIALDAIEAAVAVLTIRADDYPTYKDAQFSPRATEKELRIALVKGGDIEVYVVDPSGQPVERARVQMRVAGAEGDGKAEDTNGEGLARWRTVVPGRYEVRAYRRGADPASTAGQKVVWTTVDVQSARASEVVLEVGGAASILGTVTLAGTPLAGAQLSLANRGADAAAREAARMQRRFGGGPGGGAARASDSTDGEGRFELVDVVPGSYDLVISHTSLAMDTFEPLTIEVGENRVEIAVVVATLEGRVVDDAGAPIDGARVAASAASPSTPAAATGNRRDQRAFRSLMRDDSRDVRTDVEGRYRIVGVSTAEPLEVTARADGHVTTTTSSMLMAASETRTNVDLRLPRAGSVEVVLVSETPNPTGAIVRARFVGEGTRDDVVEIARGSTSIVDGLAPGMWEITASSFGGAGGRGTPIGEAQRVEVRAGERARVEIQR
jgi:hypothetical protein